MAINTAVTGNSAEETISALQSEFLTIESLDAECYQRYHDALKKAQEEKGEVSIVSLCVVEHFFALVIDNCRDQQCYC